MTEPATMSGTLRLVSNPNDIEKLIVLLDQVLACCKLEDLAAFRLRCAAYEVFNNCVQHAYRDEPGHPIEIHYQASPSRLSLTISDRGRAFHEPQRSDARDTMSESGRGLEIIKASVDSFDYSRRSGWNHCRLSISAGS